MKIEVKPVSKRILAMLCAFALLLMLPACRSNQPPETTTAETKSERIIETTTRPETTAEPPSYPFAPMPDEEPVGQSHEPLRGGEMAIERASINDIVGRFGAYESYSAERIGYGAGIKLKYPNMAITIAGAFSFGQGDDFEWASDNYWWVGNKDVPLTETDKTMIGRVSYLLWTDAGIDLPAPRGLKIGDSEEDVLRSYLDLRAKYTGANSDSPWYARIIYGQDDLDAQPYYEGSNIGSYQIYTDEAHPSPVACDYSIYYTCDHKYNMEGISFYIKDQMIAAIEQWCAEGD